MERISGWRRLTRNIEWIFAPDRALQRERVEKEAEKGRQIAELRTRLQTPEMKDRVAQILDKYNITTYRDTVGVPGDGKGAKLFIEHAYQEAFKRIISNQRPPTVYYLAEKMDESGLPGSMWIDEGEVRILSNQYIFAMFGGVFDHAANLGYKKIQDGIDIISQAPYGRFVQETTHGRTK